MSYVDWWYCSNTVRFLFWRIRCGVYVPMGYDHCPACGQPVEVDNGGGRSLDA